MRPRVLGADDCGDNVHDHGADFSLFGKYPLPSRGSLMSTPRTLDEAIQQALCVGPLKDTPEWGYQILRAFISEAITAAAFKAESKAEVLRLHDLLNELTKREG